jgi:hypothetical protein
MNPILEQAKAAVLKKADPRLAPVIQRTVQAGEKVMYAPETRKELIAALGDGSNPESIGAGIAKVLAVLFRKSNGTLPMQVGVPAATLLLLEALQFIEDGGKAAVTPEMLAECTKAMGSAVLQMFGITPDKLQAMFAQGGGQAAPAAPQQPQQPQPGGIVAGAQGGA